MTNKLQALKKVLIEEYGWTNEEIENKGLENIAEDFLILTDSEADAEAWQSLEDYIEDFGYEFNINLDYYVNQDVFKAYYEEYFESYIEDIKYEEGRLEEEMEEVGAETEEEFHDYLMESICDYADQYKCDFGQEEFNRFLRDNNAIDHDRLIDDVILSDGRGSILASYDGVENEAYINGQWFYIYRIN